jgi:hypothetical protein
MKRPRRTVHALSLNDRLAQAARQFKEKANRAPHGDRELLLRKARQTETAAKTNKWLSSPEESP